MRAKSWMAIAALALFAGAGTQCKANTVTYVATLSGANEVPPRATTATGYATVTLNGNLLTVSESFSGLSATAAAAHIHCCAAPGANAPVVIPFGGFPAATSGTFTNTFDLSTLVFGGGATQASFLAGLNAGLAYVNIHDSVFPGGEIRGQLVATPEPGSLMLLSTGLAGLTAMWRRRVRS